MAIDVTGSELGHQVKVWYVVFQERERIFWWDWLCKSWARHVMAIGFCVHADRWVVIDPAMNLTGVFVLNGDVEVFHMFSIAPENGHRVLIVPVKDAPVYSARIGNWCTQTISRLVGSRSSALRPHVLYRDLVLEGAEPLFEDSSDENPKDRDT